MLIEPNTLEITHTLKENKHFGLLLNLFWRALEEGFCHLEIFEKKKITKKIKKKKKKKEKQGRGERILY
jgi:hypothetical protein